MDIKDLQAEKAKLEDTIKELLEAFEEKTSCRIDDNVCVNTINFVDGKRIITSVKIKVEIV